jgi:hypothetical protein
MQIWCQANRIDLFGNRRLLKLVSTVPRIAHNSNKVCLTLVFDPPRAKALRRLSSRPSASRGPDREHNRQRAELTFSNVIVKLDKFEHGEKLSLERRIFKPSTPPCFSRTQ